MKDKRAHQRDIERGHVLTEGKTATVDMVGTVTS